MQSVLNKWMGAGNALRGLLPAALALALAPLPEASAAPQDEPAASRLPRAAQPEQELDAAQQAIAEMLDQQLFQRLSQDWSGAGNSTVFCDSGNVTIISVPSGLNVYLVRQDQIPGALNDDGEPASVEDVVFRAEQLYGQTPLTLPLPAGDYVLALKPSGRDSGFDGGCVRKAERDVITGALRHTYHLYPFTRSSGEYQLFTASFVSPDTSDTDMLSGLAEPWSFHLPEEELVAAIGQVCNAPAPLQGRIAMDLNRFGLAFYNDGRQDWLVKLGLRGSSFELRQWAVRY